MGVGNLAEYVEVIGFRVRVSTAFLKVVVWGGNGKQAEEDDEVEEVTKYVVPLLCARARCGWRRAGGRV